MKARLILLVAVLSLLGVRVAGLHMHYVAQDAQQSAAVHLATAAEDADADQAVSVEIVGQWLSHAASLSVPPLSASGLVALLALLLVSAAAVRPRAPDVLGHGAKLAYLLTPPSQAPPR